MKGLVYFTLAIFVVFLFACKGKQAKNSEDNLSAEPIQKVSPESIDSNEPANEVELKATTPQPIDAERFRNELISQCADFSLTQQRLINDLLELDSSSGKALIDLKMF